MNKNTFLKNVRAFQLKVPLLMVLIFLIIDGILLGVFFHIKNDNTKTDMFMKQEMVWYPEIDYLEGKQLSLKDVLDYFTDLAQEKGAEYAFEVLKVSSIPPPIDLHLLGHVVGDVLYAQKGIDGMEICTHDFRNACSHSIVIGAYINEGDDALSKIAQACKQAPGGKGAYTMCFHGLGHGVLSWTGYHLEETIGLCKKVGTAQYANREYIECIGGVIMEMVYGVYDLKTWAEQLPEYLDEDDPLAPCSLDYIPEEIRPICYTYLTPHLLQSAGVNSSASTAEEFEKAFSLCEKMPASQFQNKKVCYGGFGKEFVVMAKLHDVRNIENMTDEELSRVYQWCSLAGNEEGRDSCLSSALSSLYWGGENDSNVSVRFCGMEEEPERQSACFSSLIDMVGYYIDAFNYREGFCSELPQIYQEECRRGLGIKNT